MFMIFLWSFVLTSLIRSDIFNSMEEIKTIRELIMPKKKSDYVIPKNLYFDWKTVSLAQSHSQKN